MPDNHRKLGAYRRLWMVLLLSILIFALVEGFGLSSYQQQWQTLPDSQRLTQIRLALSIFFWPLLPLGLYLLYTGIQTLHIGRFPPPGTWLLRHSAPETGRAAVIRGWVMMLAGVSLGGLAVYGAVVVPGELAVLIDRSTPQ